MVGYKGNVQKSTEFLILVRNYWKLKLKTTYNSIKIYIIPSGVFDKTMLGEIKENLNRDIFIVFLKLKNKQQPLNHMLTVTTKPLNIVKIPALPKLI